MWKKANPYLYNVLDQQKFGERDQNHKDKLLKMKTQKDVRYRSCLFKQKKYMH